ncbi:MAG: glycoside hydrolase family 43 protein [Eubacterium sp.]|nr:glycoside hydrolase family 43 protein [Eubacterium sp.]
MKKSVKALALLLAVVFISAAFSSCSSEKLEAIMKPIEGDAYIFDDSNGVSVHDPSLFKSENGVYYVTGSHIASAKSTDLINWNTVSAGVYDSNRTLVKEGSMLRESLNKAFAWCDAAQTLWQTAEDDWQTNVWASTVIYNKAMGKYCYYACASVWGTPMSVIWLAVSDDPEGTFEFVDTVIYSGFNNCFDDHKKPLNQLHYSYTNIAELIKKGTFTKKEINAQPWFDEWGNYDCSYGKYPNAIDPALFYDKDGNLWLTYGSFSGGIYIMPIVEETGLPDYKKMRDTEGYDIYFGKQISCTNEETENTGEGPFIVYDKQSGYYYLFLTYGGLSALEGYNIREYRSENPDGPYIDAAGNDACDMKSTGIRIIPNYQFSSDKVAYLSAGHSSCLIDDDGKIYQAYHQRYNDGVGGFFNVQIHQMLRTTNGWLTVLPTAYNGETAAAVTLSDIVGEYEMILFSSQTKKTEDWSKVSDIIEPTVTAVIDANGKVSIDGKEGTINLDNNSYTFTLDLNSRVYYGVFCIGTQNGKSVMTASAMSDTNQSLWAVRK